MVLSVATPSHTSEADFRQQGTITSLRRALLWDQLSEALARMTCRLRSSFGKHGCAWRFARRPWAHDVIVRCSTSNYRRERPLQKWRIAKALKASEVTISRMWEAREPENIRLFGNELEASSAKDTRLRRCRKNLALNSEIHSPGTLALQLVESPWPRFKRTLYGCRG